MLGRRKGSKRKASGAEECGAGGSSAAPANQAVSAPQMDAPASASAHQSAAAQPVPAPASAAAPAPAPRPEQPNDHGKATFITLDAASAPLPSEAPRAGSRPPAKTPDPESDDYDDSVERPHFVHALGNLLQKARQLSGMPVAAEAHSTDFPGVDVPGVGLLSHPLPDDAAAKLKTVATPVLAPGDVAPHVWRLPPAAFAIRNGDWDMCAEEMAELAVASLGVRKETVYRLELAGLLMCEAGGSLTPVLQSRPSSAFATLLIVLPSVHSGGAFKWSHDGDEGGYPHNIEFATGYFAFYNSVKCSMLPLASGRCLWLAYDLCRIEGPVPAPAERLPIAKEIADFIRKWEKRAGPSKIVYMLEGRCRPEELSWGALSAAERNVKEVLQRAVGLRHFQIFLHSAEHVDDGHAETFIRGKYLHAPTNFARDPGLKDRVYQRELLPPTFWQQTPPDMSKKRYTSWENRAAIVLFRTSAAAAALALQDEHVLAKTEYAVAAARHVISRGHLDDGAVAAVVIPVVAKLDATGELIRSFVRACLSAEWGTSEQCCAALSAALRSLEWRECGTLVAGALTRFVDTRGTEYEAATALTMSVEATQFKVVRMHNGVLRLLEVFAAAAPAQEAEAALSRCARTVRTNAEQLLYAVSQFHNGRATHAASVDSTSAFVTAVARRARASEVRTQTAVAFLLPLAPLLVAAPAQATSLSAACAEIGWAACVRALAASPLHLLVATDAQSVAPLLSAAAAALARPDAAAADILGLLQVLSKFPEAAEAPPLEPLFQRLGSNEQIAFATESIRNFAARPEKAIALMQRLAAVAPHAAPATVDELFRFPKLFASCDMRWPGACALTELLAAEEKKVSPTSPLPALIRARLLERFGTEFDRGAAFVMAGGSRTFDEVLRALREALAARLSAGGTRPLSKAERAAKADLEFIESLLRRTPKYGRQANQ